MQRIGAFCNRDKSLIFIELQIYIYYLSFPLIKQMDIKFLLQSVSIHELARGATFQMFHL